MNNYKKRITAILIIFGVMAFGLGLRLFFLQVVNYRFYLEKALEQRQRIINLAAPRGDILDRSGRILATTVDSPSVFANPREVTDEARTAEKLANILGKSKFTHILNQLSRKKSFVWLERKIPDSQAARIVELNLAGIYILTEKKRIYPSGRLASQVLGFVGLDNQGLAGVELFYDEYLRGREGRILTERDPTGHDIVGAKELILEEPSYGMNLVLSIDEYVQYVCQKRLVAAVKQYGGLRGSAMVLDVKDGEILAMASYPDFDPNFYYKFPPSSWKCGPTSFVYEPGSTFKVITTASAVDAGLVDRNTHLKYMTQLKIGGRTIENSHAMPKFAAKGYMTVSEMLEQSANTGAAQLGIKLGKERFYEYIKKFGFGDMVGVGMPDESSGIVYPPSRWWAPDIAMICFGQAIAITPLQLVNAVAAIANNGQRFRPILAKRIESLDGMFVKSFAKENLNQVLSSKNIPEIAAIMENVTVLGSGKRGRMENFRVASKTGTAQKVGPGGFYMKGHYIASYIEFVPVSDPRLVIFVMVDDPKGVIWGETVAGPAAKLIAEDSLRYLDVCPDIVSSDIINPKL